MNEISPKNPRILLVEGDPAYRNLLLSMCDMLGATPETSMNGYAALARLKEKNYDLALLDCGISGMDGYALCRAFREWEKSERPQKYTPIIAISGLALEADFEKCKAAGMDDHFRKPVKVWEFKEKILRWLCVGKVADSREKETDSPPPFDSQEDLLREIREDLGPSFVPVVRKFMGSLERSMASIREAVARKDSKSIDREAHALRGASLTLGFSRLGDLARKIEESGKSGDLTGIEDRFAQLENEASRARDFLKNIS